MYNFKHKIIKITISFVHIDSTLDQQRRPPFKFWKTKQH